MADDPGEVALGVVVVGAVVGAVPSFGVQAPMAKAARTAARAGRAAYLRRLRPEPIT
ncbi:MAG TPA: hypothetical protein P5181_00875 [Dermatophilaceae bacterium]|nr:hypothetical protein [Dermatophilaceae bacterium]